MQFILAYRKERKQGEKLNNQHVFLDLHKQKCKNNSLWF